MSRHIRGACDEALQFVFGILVQDAVRDAYATFFRADYHYVDSVMGVAEVIKQHLDQNTAEAHQRDGNQRSDKQVVGGYVHKDSPGMDEVPDCQGQYGARKYGGHHLQQIDVGRISHHCRIGSEHLEENQIAEKVYDKRVHEMSRIAYYS